MINSCASAKQVGMAGELGQEEDGMSLRGCAVVRSSLPLFDFLRGAYVMRCCLQGWQTSGDGEHDELPLASHLCESAANQQSHTRWGRGSLPRRAGWELHTVHSVGSKPCLADPRCVTKSSNPYSPKEMKGFLTPTPKHADLLIGNMLKYIIFHI